MTFGRLDFPEEDEAGATRERGGQSVVSENASLDDPAVKANVNIVVDWLVSQIEHVLHNRLLGGLARTKMTEMLKSFEAHLKRQGLGPEMTGVILQQTYLRIKRLLER